MAADGTRWIQAAIVLTRKCRITKLPMAHYIRVLPLPPLGVQHRRLLRVPRASTGMEVAVRAQVVTMAVAARTQANPHVRVSRTFTGILVRRPIVTIRVVVHHPALRVSTGMAVRV